MREKRHGGQGADDGNDTTLSFQSPREMSSTGSMWYAWDIQKGKKIQAMGNEKNGMYLEARHNQTETLPSYSIDFDIVVCQITIALYASLASFRHGLVEMEWEVHANGNRPCSMVSKGRVGLGTRALVFERCSLPM
jgi:hypothetical protein